jgi:hypothetical protein
MEYARHQMSDFRCQMLEVISVVDGVVADGQPVLISEF